MASRSDLRHELALLVLSRYPVVVLESADEDRVEALAVQVASDLDLPLWVWSSTHGLLRRGGAPLANTRDPEAALAQLHSLGGGLIALLRDLHPYFDRPAVVRRIREIAPLFAKNRSSLLLCGVQVPVPAELSHMTATLEISLPDVSELEQIVRETARELEGQGRIVVELDGAVIRRMAFSLRGLHAQEAQRVLYQAALRDGRLSQEDEPALHEGKKHGLKLQSQLEWIEPLEGGLDSLGGAGNLRRFTLMRREAFGEAAARFGLEPPRGVLLVGVPGTGKSLACRAVAAGLGLPLLRLDPGRLYDKFVGETEANLRRALLMCETLAPVVLWLDEIEKALATGSGVADDGLSQRMLGTLLTWMQERPAPVFLAATSNDISRLPVELLRRGRFDEIFFFDLPSAPERASIFGIHLARRGRDPAQFDLEGLATSSDGFSGAEIEGLVVAGLYHAFAVRSQLTTEILLAEAAATRPLSRVRSHEVAALRAWGQRHAVPA